MRNSSRLVIALLCASGIALSSAWAGERLSAEALLDAEGRYPIIEIKQKVEDEYDPQAAHMNARGQVKPDKATRSATWDYTLHPDEQDVGQSVNVRLLTVDVGGVRTKEAVLDSFSGAPRLSLSGLPQSDVEEYRKSHSIVKPKHKPVRGEVAAKPEPRVAKVTPVQPKAEPKPRVEKPKVVAVKPKVEPRPVKELAAAAPKKKSQEKLVIASRVEKKETAKEQGGAVDMFRLRIGDHAEKTRLVFDLTGKSSYRSAVVKQGRFLVLEVQGAKLDMPVRKSFAGHSLIDQYSARAHKDGRVTLVIALRQASNLSWSTMLPPNDEYKYHRIVLDLKPRQ